MLLSAERMSNHVKTVFVGLSGGVDSSVAALRLQTAGYHVVGVFIKVWHPDFLVCDWERERRDAMRVAAILDIPFLTCDAETAYFDHVAKEFIAEYEAGRTPNPDVLCNQFVKFGAFLNFATEHGADYIATGHYAQVHYDTEDKGPYIVRGVDMNKDQSYFLWTLTSEQLAKVLLPVGDTTKAAIREEASDAGLPTADKADSQGICFLGQVDIPEFLSHYIELTPGLVYDAHGQEIGTHQGAVVYTIGQRHGFTITNPEYSGLPMYVQRKDVANNTIIVDTTPPQPLSTDTITLRGYNLTRHITAPATITIQTRYRQTPMSATVTDITSDCITLTVTDAPEHWASGQSCVLYNGDICLGGGIISECQ